MSTKQELTNLLSSFQEALEFWTKSSTTSDEPVNEASRVADPLKELEKCTKLIKAHTTKVGIMFNPENLFKEQDNFSPAYSVLEKLSETLVLMFAVAKLQLQPEQVSHLLYDEVQTGLHNLYALQRYLASELLSVLEGSSGERLVGVGRVWANCDEVIALIEGGKLGLLTNKIAQSVLLIDDGFEEFAEWAEDPQSVDFDDFGEDDEELEEEEDEAQDEKLAEFAQKWVKKIEMVRLLVNSFKKSLPLSTSVGVVDEIYLLQSTLVKLIDTFISDLMMDQVVDDEIEAVGKNVSSTACKLCSLAVRVHEKNDKKRNWYLTWERKFNA